MNKGDAGMIEEARMGYWKEIHKESRSQRSDQEVRKLAGGGGCIFAYFFIYILLLSERDKEAKERALTGTAQGCARYVIYTSGNHASERGTADRRCPIRTTKYRNSDFASFKFET